MTDVEFLQWMHDRVVEVYGEHKDMNFMHKFRSIIEAQKASSNTVYTKCTNELYNMFDNPEGKSSADILRILRKHFV